jgi:ribonucleoside-diphosphate reductase alpha chain
VVLSYHSLEITLHADEMHSYSCVLSGLVAATYDEWKGTNAVFCMTVFLDCLVSLFLDEAKGIKGLEKIIRGTEKGRPLGLGVTGFHSYLQSKMLPFASLEAQMINMKLFKELHDESLRASQWMANHWGEPEWCKGYGVRNTHRTALAPNVSSSLIFGSWSQGCGPWYGNVYNEGSASGGMFRVNPFFIEILKKHGQYNDKVLKFVLEDNGSAQNLDFLTDLEKEVLKTAFELDQEEVLRVYSTRQRWICQGQSLNLHFSADEDEEYIAKIHQIAFEDEGIHSLYYLRGRAGVAASKGACTACES